MVRSVAGTKGEERGGSYVILDPRTKFYVPDDRQVIVYFEWEAPKRTHHCEGTVKGPNGQLAVMSSFDYPATQTKFGGYWTIPLLENSSPGLWTFESRVDGEFAGELGFEIVSAKRPADAVKEEVPPTPAEIYNRAVAAVALVEKLDEKGQPLGAGSGFFVGENFFVTSFRVIDGAHQLRMQFSDGSRTQAESVIAWNRRQDWAILQAEAGRTPKLSVAASKSWSIGDHCYWLDTKTDGGRVIADGQIVGKESRQGGWGDRISISNTFNTAAAGGPLLNERGEILGFLGGASPETLVPRVLTDVQVSTGASSSYAITGTAVPIGMVTGSLNANPTTLQTLWSQGQFTAPITASRNVSFGMMTQGKPQKGKPFAREMKLEFTRQDDSATILVSLQSIDTLKTTTELRVYDADNRLVNKGEPIKITLRRGEQQERYWSFPPGSFPAGVYRADVLLGDAVAWRTYFRVLE